MQDHIPDALITAFERQYDSSWNDPQLRNERLAMRYGWAAAMEAKPCLHQIQEPAPATAMDALREAEAALEVAMARILKADPGHSICVTSEAKALVAVRAALAAPAPMLVAQPQLHAALFAARGALQHMKEGGKPTQSLLNEAIAAIDSVAVTQAASSQRATVRYCPECGHIGEVGAGHRDCCPDGSQAFMVPEKHAEGLRTGFLAQIAQAAPAAVAVPDEREALQDGEWYWIEKEGWHGNPPTIAPALYKAECDAWYSFAFAGIPTRQLKVLEPCLLQARAALAATPTEAPENVREGSPFDNPEFERLARELGVWGTAQSAICAQFWLAATTAADAPLPLLVRDIARELGITCVEACLALKPLGNFSTNTAVTAGMMAKLRECFPERVPASEVAGARERMTAGRACYFMERFLKEEKLLGPNEQAALHYVIDMLEAAAAPVVLPEPDADYKLVPVALTPEMKREFMDLLMDGIDIYVNSRDQIEIQTDAPRRIWNAVLALSPVAPAHPAEGVQEPTDIRATIMGTPLGVFGTGIGDIGIAYRAGHRAALLTAAERIATKATKENHV